MGCLTECEIETAGGGCFVLVAGEEYPGRAGIEGRESAMMDRAESACFCSSARVGIAGIAAGEELRREDAKGESLEAINQVAMLAKRY